MTFPSMLRRVGALASLVLSAVALSGCPDGGGGVSEALTQQAYLKASNTADDFGYSVALDGDTLVVGAYLEDSAMTGVTAGAPNETVTGNGATNSGAVYVFVKTNGVWNQQAYIKPSNTESGDGFGSSVAVDGDTLVVGAYLEDSTQTGVTAGSPNEAATGNGASASGAVYVFTRTNGSWTQQAYIKPSNTDSNDQFGYSVAISGNTLVVGARFESGAQTGFTAGSPNNTTTGNGASNSGAAYVFTRVAGAWSQEAYLKASNTGAGDRFGSSVALSSETLVVGAEEEDSALSVPTAGAPNEASTGNAASGSGAVYVFTRSGTNWSQQAYLKPSNTDLADNFGFSVALSGNTLAVGASGEDSALTGVIAASPNEATTGNGAPDSGAVYVFTRSGTNWSQQAYVKASNTESSDIFGYSLALDGEQLVVGAYAEDSNATGLAGIQSDNSAPDAGAAYLFTRTAGVWSQQAYVKASNTEAGDQFGQSVALSGAILAVGGSREDSALTGVTTDTPNEATTGNSASDSGAVYVFQP